MAGKKEKKTASVLPKVIAGVKIPKAVREGLAALAKNPLVADLLAAGLVSLAAKVRGEADPVQPAAAAPAKPAKPAKAAKPATAAKPAAAKPAKPAAAKPAKTTAAKPAKPATASKPKPRTRKPATAKPAD